MSQDDELDALIDRAPAYSLTASFKSDTWRDEAIRAIVALRSECDALLNMRVERHEYEAMKRDKQEALDHYSRVREEIFRLRKIAAHVPGIVYIKAKEAAGFGENVMCCGKTEPESSP